MNREEYDRQTHRLCDEIAATVSERDIADARLTRLLIEGREMTPPLPMSALAKAMGITEAGVSLRLSRHRQATTRPVTP